VDAARHKEALLKARLQPRIDEAYTITNSIEAKLVTLQETQERIRGNSSTTAVTEQRIDEVQQVAAQCAAEIVGIQLELGGLHANISAPTK